MTRVVKELDGRVVTSNRRQAVDSYARPFYHVNSHLSSIASALEKWNPVFINRARQAEEQKWNREVEEGKAIAMQYAGKDYTLAQIEADINAGNGGRYVALSKAQKEGINQLQLEQGLNNVSLKIQEAYDSATFKDKDGNEHRLYESKDPMAFQQWFDNKYNELWEAETGGVYDRSLYGQLGSRHRAQARNSLYSQFLSARGEMKRREADISATQVLDTYYDNALNSGRYVGNSKMQGELRAVLNRITEERDRVGDGGDGAVLTTNYLLMKMGTATHNNEVQFLLDNAKGVKKVWENPTYRSKLEHYAEQKRKQFEAEVYQRQVQAYQNARMKLGYAQLADSWKARDGLNTATAVAKKYLAEVGNDWNRLGEVADKLMNDPAVAKNRFALNIAHDFVKSYGKNIPYIQDLMIKAYKGANIDYFAAVDNRQLSPETALAIASIQDKSDYKDKNNMYSILQKYAESVIPKPDPTMQMMDANAIAMRQSAVNAMTDMMMDSVSAQFNGPINTASPEFAVAVANASKDAVAVYGSQEAQERAYAKDNFRVFGDIANTKPTTKSVMTFLDTSGILSDPDVAKEVVQLISSRGLKLPSRISPNAEAIEQSLANKNYQINDQPIKTLNDLCYIVRFLSDQDWSALVSGLGGNVNNGN